jgi:ABC-type transport system involved in multi-copper enzyme maturation permease subunit
MVGPVLHLEMLLGGRRNRLHVLRWIYAGWLVTMVIYFFLQFQSEEYQKQMLRWQPGGQYVVNKASAPEVVGARFSESFVRQQMLLVLLLTPAFVAGAITDEKRRGTLQYLMTTDVESRHIVLGKLLGRAGQVGLVLLGGLPLFALLAGFGGVEPATLGILGLALVMPLLGVAAAALLASVWCRQTRDAVLALYLVVVVVGLAVYLIGGPFRLLDPVYVLAPAWGPRGSLDLAEAGRRLVPSVLVWGGIALGCGILAAWRLRPIYIRELESIRPQRDAWYSAVRAAVQDDPIRWRERHVEGLAPNPTLRSVPQWLAISAVASLTTLSSLLILYFSLARGTTFDALATALVQLNLPKLGTLLPDASVGFLIQGLVAILVASLIVGIRCSGSVTGEREKQTWEAVLLTPISARQLIRGKLWGVMGASYWYLLAYAAPAVTLSVLGGPLALTWTILWLGVTVLAMYFVGAAGVYCSVTSRSSWRSLLNTLAIGYVGGGALYAVTSPIIGVLALILILFLAMIDALIKTNMAALCFRHLGTFLRVFFVASCVALVVIFILMSRLFIARSWRYIADRERTRHWHEEPFYRRPRRDPPVGRLYHFPPSRQ